MLFFKKSFINPQRILDIEEKNQTKGIFAKKLAVRFSIIFPWKIADILEKHQNNQQLNEEDLNITVTPVTRKKNGVMTIDQAI